jgi:hypothetical protein
MLDFLWSYSGIELRTLETIFTLICEDCARNIAEPLRSLDHSALVDVRIAICAARGHFLVFPQWHEKTSGVAVFLEAVEACAVRRDYLDGRASQSTPHISFLEPVIYDEKGARVLEEQLVFRSKCL